MIANVLSDGLDRIFADLFDKILQIGLLVVESGYLVNFEIFFTSSLSQIFLHIQFRVFFKAFEIAVLFNSRLFDVTLFKVDLVLKNVRFSFHLQSYIKEVLYFIIRQNYLVQKNRNWGL